MKSPYARFKDNILAADLAKMRSLFSLKCLANKYGFNSYPRTV